MICRVCLLDSTEQLEIFGTVGVQLGITSVISQHFWFEPKLHDPISNMICSPCWRKLDNFHKFYTSVEEAHSQLSERLCVKEEPGIKNEGSDNIMVEFAVVDKKGQIFNISKPNYFNNEWNQQNSLEFENTESIPANEGRMHVEEPLKDATNKANEYSNAAEEETKSSTSTKLEEIHKDKAYDEKLVPSAEEESSKVQSLRKTRKESLLGRKCANRKESENSYDSSPENTSSQSQLKEKNRGPKDLKTSQEYDETIAKHMKLKCEICGAEFNIFSEVTEHFRSVHKRKGYVICCNKKLRDRVSIMDHINKHLNPDYFKCKECNKVFSDRQGLATHMLRHVSEEAKIFKCEKCPRRYAKQFLLDVHKVIHIPQEEREFFCDDCGKAFPTNNLLIIHHRIVHENAYGQTCHICAKVIRGKALFKKHQLEHAGVVEPKVQCEKCGVWLKHAYSLRRHMRYHVEKLSTHVCNICGKTAPSKSALRDHVRYVHEPESSLHCSVCDKTFKRPKRLREHMTTHTGEPLYTCPYCPKTFNSSGNMYTHRKKVHRKEWEESRRSRGLPTSDTKLMDSETD